MKIRSLEARSYRYPLDPPLRAAWDPTPRQAFRETIVTVRSEEGLAGHCGGNSVPDLDLLSHLLVGREIDAVAVLAILETVDYHGGRNWTVEVAVWDLLARAAGEPLWRYLGSNRDRYPVYQSTAELIAAEERVDRLSATRAAGVGAAKLRLGPDWQSDLKVVEQVRMRLGDEFELMVDANQGWRMPGDTTARWDLATALDCLSICDELGVYWVEEPLDPAQLEDYRKLRSQSSVRIAAGEMVRALGESHRLIDVVDVIQNDVVLAGGVGGCRQVSQWAQEAAIKWSPHTWSTGYGLLANLHVALAYSTAPYLEYPLDPPAWTPARRDFMLPEPLKLDQSGSLVAPTGPGLGVEPDFEFLEQWRVA